MFENTHMTQGLLGAQLPTFLIVIYFVMVAAGAVVLFHPRVRESA